MDHLKAEAEAFFARDDIWANLVTMRQIMDRTGVRAISVVASWKSRYRDFPEPIRPTDRADANYAYMARYWWPEVQAFLDRHGFPDPESVERERRKAQDRK